MNLLYSLVAERAAHRCEYCRAPEGIFNYAFEVEHIFPKNFGGNDDEGNLALACRACNLFKSDHLTGFDGLTQQEVQLFHPRQDQWKEHFTVEVESRKIIGLTPLGRATVMRLRMNQAFSLVARAHWMRFGLFP